MKRLTFDAANRYLSEVGLHIGSWGQIAISNHTEDTQNWIQYQKPKDALHLYNFSQHMLGWLPSSRWKLIKLDYSSPVSVPATVIMDNLWSEQQQQEPVDRTKSMLIEYSEDASSNYDKDVKIAFFINCALLFETHGYIACSEGSQQILGVQDGFAYFIAREKSDLDRARDIVTRFEQNPLISPEWITDIPPGRQE